MKILSRFCITITVLFLLSCEEASQSRDTAQEILNSQASFSVQNDPNLTFAAFQRFWLRGAGEFITLDGLKKIENGYMVEYGQSVTLYIFLLNDMVSGISIEYATRSDTYSGGLQFKRLMEHMLLVGTFFWSQEERAKLFQYFFTMSHEKKEFVFKRSYFIRNYVAPIWTFDLIFVNEGEKLRTKP